MGSIKSISLKNDDLIVILYDLSIIGTEIVKMKKEGKKKNCTLRFLLFRSEFFENIKKKRINHKSQLNI